jgi:hypothetical protein
MLVLCLTWDHPGYARTAIVMRRVRIHHHFYIGVAGSCRTHGINNTTKVPGTGYRYVSNYCVTIYRYRLGTRDAGIFRTLDSVRLSIPPYDHSSSILYTHYPHALFQIAANSNHALPISSDEDLVYLAEWCHPSAALKVHRMES